MGSNLLLDKTADTYKPPWEAMSIHDAKKISLSPVSKHRL